MTKVTPPTRQVLAALPYLAAVPPDELRRLADRCVWKSVGRGGVIFREGEAARGLFVIGEGRVKLSRLSPSGREQVLHVEGAGASLGEVPVFDGGGYVATAVALTAARVLFVDRDALFALCRRRPDVALGVIAVLARRLRRFAALIADLALRDVAGRVAAFLLAEAAPAGAPFEIGTQDEVAARLGTVRELVSRSLARLAEAGLIARAGRRVRVLDADGLRRLADAQGAAR
jgi:CRP/FNR family transcriptional regulator, dissimilatory nitrate respiration regulator